MIKKNSSRRRRRRIEAMKKNTKKNSKENMNADGMNSNGCGEIGAATFIHHIILIVHFY